MAVGGLGLPTTAGLAAGTAAIGICELDVAVGAPAGAATGNVPPLAEGAAFARLWALSCRALAWSSLVPDVALEPVDVGGSGGASALGSAVGVG